MTDDISATRKPGAHVTPLEKLTDLAKASPLGRLIQSAMSDAASAFGVALIAAPCYAVAAPAPGASTLASANSTSARQRSASESASIRPFTFRAQQAALDDLRRRIVATQWPEKETVADQSQGVPLATLADTDLAAACARCGSRAPSADTMVHDRVRWLW